jgi:DNA-binding Lrp family transcriptional regulator
MVTDNELSKIMQLRANGRTHQEIADEIGISRSTVAYQLSKLKEKEIPNDPIQIIIANSFEPNMTTVTFTPHEFEKHRKNQQLYAAGRSLFELRGDVIHKTDIPNNLLNRVEDYPEVARIIGKNPNWSHFPNIGQWRQRLAQFKTHQKPSFMNKIFSDIKQKMEADLWLKIPNDNLKLIKLSETDINPQELYDSTVEELSRLLSMDRDTGEPFYMTRWANENEISKEDISFCITNQITTKTEYVSLKNSGVSSRQQYDEMKKAGYSTWDEYQRARVWAQAIQPIQILHGRRYNPGPVNPVPPGQLAELDKSGWDPNEYRIANQLGFTLSEKDLHAELKLKLPNLGLQWNQQNISWAKGVNLQHYEGFPTPKAATMYGIIEMSPTSHLRLDSLLIQYNQSSAPGHNINSVEALHKILIQSPFSDICVSNLEGGIVERTSNNLVVIEKEVVKEIILEKEVEKKVKPLFNYSGYAQLNSVDDEQNKEIISAIENNSSKDVLSKAWIRFESNAKHIWTQKNPEITWKDQRESWKKEDSTKGHAVRLTDYVANLLSIPEKNTNLLHGARMERNEIQHPTGRKLRITNLMITNLLEMTEQIILSTSQQ